MKRTQFTDLRMTIRATFVSFFSIAMFVALAVAIFLGIDWSGKALRAGAETSFEENNFHDLEVLFPYGLVEDDVAALKGIEGVSAVEAGRVSFQTVIHKGTAYSMRLGSMGTDIDKLVVWDGKLPDKDGQIAVEALWAKRKDVVVGDKLVLSGDEFDKSQLVCDTFTVTALVESPAYLSNSANTWGASSSASGSLDLLAWAPLSTFDVDDFRNGYTDVLVRSDALRGNATSSDEYASGSSALARRVEELGEKRSYARHDELVAEAQDELDEAKAKLDDARQKLDDGERELEEKGQELEDAKAKISDGEKQILDAEAKIPDAEKQIADGEAKIADGEKLLAEAESLYSKKKAEFDKKNASVKKQLDEKKSALEDARSEYEKKRSQLDEAHALYKKYLEEFELYKESLDEDVSAELADVLATLEKEVVTAKHVLDAADAEIVKIRKTLESAEEAYNEALAEYQKKVSEAESQLSGGKSKIESGRAEIAKAKSMLAEKKAEFEDAKSMLAEKKAELEDAKSKVADGEKKLEDAKEELKDAKAEIEDKSAEYDSAVSAVDRMREHNYNWTVLTRSKNGGVVSVENFVDIAGRLRTSMALLFVVVGLLVCYSAMSRLVHKHVVQIGTKKALGMYEREVTAQYLLYALVAVLMGMVLGVAGAVLVVERIIVPVLSASFHMKVPLIWLPMGAFLFTMIENALILAATWLACHRVLAKQAVELLNGEATHRSKERFFESWGLWTHLPLYLKATINNMFNDKRRVVGTLVGVAGCTALVVCAVTLNDDVMAGLTKQYVDVYHYDTLVRVNLDEEDAMRSAEDKVEALGCEVSCPIATRTVSMSLGDDSSIFATITVPEDATDFGRTVTLISTSGDTRGTAVTPDNTGIWMSRAYADHYGAKPGDTLEVVVGDGTKYQLPIAGFFEHYLVGHQIVMTRDLYKQVFGDNPTMSKLYVRSGDLEFDQIEEALSDESCISAVVDDRTDQETVFNSFRKVSRVVVMVYLALSVAMAVVVLMNLNIMFVEEKRRDLITLMVCGYSVRSAKRYVWYDNVVLTILGVLLGIALGIVTGWAAVVSMEVANVSLAKDIVLRACLAGAASSAILSAIMTIVAVRRIPKMQLSDINRL